MGKVTRTVLIPQRVNASYESNRPIAFEDMFEIAHYNMAVDNSISDLLTLIY